MQLGNEQVFIVARVANDRGRHIWAPVALECRANAFGQRVEILLGKVDRPMFGCQQTPKTQQVSGTVQRQSVGDASLERGQSPQPHLGLVPRKPEQPDQFVMGSVAGGRGRAIEAVKIKPTGALVDDRTGDIWARLRRKVVAGAIENVDNVGCAGTRQPLVGDVMIDELPQVGEHRCQSGIVQILRVAVTVELFLKRPKMRGRLGREGHAFGIWEKEPKACALAQSFGADDACAAVVSCGLHSSLLGQFWINPSLPADPLTMWERAVILV